MLNCVHQAQQTEHKNKTKKQTNKRELTNVELRRIEAELVLGVEARTIERRLDEVGRLSLRRHGQLRHCFIVVQAANLRAQQARGASAISGHARKRAYRSETQRTACERVSRQALRVLRRTWLQTQRSLIGEMRSFVTRHLPTSFFSASAALGSSVAPLMFFSALATMSSADADPLLGDVAPLVAAAGAAVAAVDDAGAGVNERGFFRDDDVAS